MAQALNPLPDDIPETRAWRSAELADEHAWITQPEPDVLEDVQRVAAALPADRAAWVGLTASDATTPRLADWLGSVAEELAQGRGFSLLRLGSPGRELEGLRRAFWVMGLHLGTPVSQNARGHVLTEVSDRFGGAARTADTRGYESNDELRFHTDGADVIGLACARQAPRGGTSGLVSMLAIYNELRAHHPQHLDPLLRGFPIYMRREQGDASVTRHLGKVQDRRLPVFAWEEGRAAAWLNIKLTELAAEQGGAPLSEAETAALACFEEIAERPDMKLRFQLEPGDVLWIHNFSVMHRRDAYEDHEDPAKRRTLFRMWLNLHLAPPLAPALKGIRRGIPGPAPSIQVG